ncbi:MAG: DedA family protein [Candidatus Micrarchaeota archaeon]|nr:DedA family protein [Candidatus Micrarchaeota archaeon]
MDLVLLTTTLASYLATLTDSYSLIDNFLIAYGYFAIFILMMLEYASFPIPSEVVLPLVGFFAAQHDFSFFAALLVVLAAGVIGMFIDYFFAYYVGRNVVYRYSPRLGIKREQLHEFEDWFEMNGRFAVFIGRLIPVVRGLISFPAGFAKMNKTSFILFSFAGSLIWDVVLMLFGYFGLGANDANIVLIGIAAFTVALYTIYRVSIVRIERMSVRHAHG